MNKHRFLFVTFVFTLCAKAQITVPTDIPSPNAADLGEFGNVPVSYYTGKADISIPLFTHSVKGVSLPISLAYNAGGVMINKLPGWTGENWALRAGVSSPGEGEDNVTNWCTIPNYCKKKCAAIFSHTVCWAIFWKTRLVTTSS